MDVPADNRHPIHPRSRDDRRVSDKMLQVLIYACSVSDLAAAEDLIWAYERAIQRRARRFGENTDELQQLAAARQLVDQRRKIRDLGLIEEEI